MLFLRRVFRILRAIVRLSVKVQEKKICIILIPYSSSMMDTNKFEISLEQNSTSKNRFKNMVKKVSASVQISQKSINDSYLSQTLNQLSETDSPLVSPCRY
mmetsp:Transcript_17852/g.20621  ORF Transcript_17852/g.20621 Transcript_17852/m.20621 type:complete len:101 (-) Transcript_17852:23-325(-)